MESDNSRNRMLIDYHLHVINSPHIFVYAVLGRSSSTAVQRILNSSGEVCIWGEPHGTIDTIISTINTLRIRNTRVSKLSSQQAFYQAFLTKRHTLFYPNALNDLSETIQILESSISAMLVPVSKEVERFGFKDIGVSNFETIQFLRCLYKNSQVVFCFRNPLDQWTSVSSNNWWNYSQNLDLFLEEYVRVSKIYLKFSDYNREVFFIENSDVRIASKVEVLFKFLNLERWDPQLLDLNVGSCEKRKLTKLDSDKIIASKAFECYLFLKSRSETFFK